MGIERLILTMEKQGCEFIESNKCLLYLAPMGENALVKILTIAHNLREEGYWVEYDVVGRSLKAQMKYADKIGALFTMVLGDNELETNNAKLKNMSTGEQIEISLDEDFYENFADIAIAGMFRESLQF